MRRRTVVRVLLFVLVLFVAACVEPVSTPLPTQRGAWPPAGWAEDDLGLAVRLTAHDQIVVSDYRSLVDGDGFAITGVVRNDSAEERTVYAAVNSFDGDFDLLGASSHRVAAALAPGNGAPFRIEVSAPVTATRFYTIDITGSIDE